MAENTTADTAATQAAKAKAEAMKKISEVKQIQTTIQVAKAKRLANRPKPRVGGK